jgi:hypothetical protein
MWMTFLEISGIFDMLTTYFYENKCLLFDMLHCLIHNKCSTTNQPLLSMGSYGRLVHGENLPNTLIGVVDKGEEAGERSVYDKPFSLAG